MASTDLRLEYAELKSMGFVNELGTDNWRLGHVVYDAGHGSWWRDGWQFNPRTVDDLQCDKEFAEHTSSAHGKWDQ